MLPSKTSVKDLEASAQKGDRQAQNALGMLNELGLIPEASDVEAKKWFGAAVKGGDPEAALALARLQEMTVPKGDAKIVAALYQVAAKQGFRAPADRVKEAFPQDRKKTVLVVDDLETYRRTTGQLLEKLGYKVSLAQDAYAALRLVEKGTPIDLILTDLDMPEMNGVEMLQLIRQRYRRTELPVVMVTASRDVELLKKAKALGLQGWILKPYNAEMLKQTVEKILREKKAS